MTAFRCKPLFTIERGPVHLPADCVGCRGLVTLQFFDWNLDEGRRQMWRCPYCHTPNEERFPGRLAWVTVRADETTRH